MSKLINYKSNKVFVCTVKTGYVLYINMIEVFLTRLYSLEHILEILLGKMLAK